MKRIMCARIRSADCKFIVTFRPCQAADDTRPSCLDGRSTKQCATINIKSGLCKHDHFTIQTTVLRVSFYLVWFFSKLSEIYVKRKFRIQ